MSISIRFLFTTALGAAALCAQYPGQDPGYPGGYPGGQYPGGGGIPRPRLPRRGKKTNDGTKDDEQKLDTYSGTVRKVTEKAITIEAKDTRILEIAYSDATKFFEKAAEIKPAVIHPGDALTVDAKQDDQGYITAVKVTLDKRGEESAAAEAPTPSGKPDPASAKKGEAATAEAAPEPDAVTPAHDPAEGAEEGPPRLKHGKVAQRKSEPIPKEEEPAPAPPRARVERTSAEPPPSQEEHLEGVAPETPDPTRVSASLPNSGDSRIEKAREAALNFTETLPSYVCKEQITRFVSETRTPSWKPLDVVSTDVVYEDGRERYQNLQIDGKPVKKNMEELSGSWSTGEFGTILVDLFSPSTSARFRFVRDSRISGREAYLFDFTVEHERSHWHVQVASQSVYPAFRGSLWVDKTTGRALRIEMQASSLPVGFPMDRIESAVDYQFVRIAERDYLLPVHSESLSCQRGSDICSRNAIDFRNYHKYSGESSITFEK